MRELRGALKKDRKQSGFATIPARKRYCCSCFKLEPPRQPL
jgi:hypothetical protein